MATGVKTSALALVPGVDVWPVIQALRLKHDAQVRVWPPHINILYPFVSEHDFAEAADRLVAATSELAPLRIRFCRKASFGSTAFLVPECDMDPGLVQLHALCRSAFPDLEQPHRCFSPHLTIGKFKSVSECNAFLEGCPPIELETEIECLSLLVRSTMQHPFRTALRVRLAMGAGGVEQGDAMPYVFRALQVQAAPNDPATQERRNIYQVDDTCVRLVFQVEADTMGECSGCQGPKHTLFVVDQSASMQKSYSKVKQAVRYMVDQTGSGGHELSFVLYNTAAHHATAQDVLRSEAGGMTSFQSAFEKIVEHVKGQPRGTNLSIVFMTDGQDNKSTNLGRAKADFHQFLQGCDLQTVVHTIGFTESHEHNFLKEICTMGTSEGMYRYADEDNSLETRFAEMFDFATVNTKVSLQLGDTDLRVDAVDAGDGTLRFDLLLRKEQLVGSPCGTHPWRVLVGGQEVVLAAERPDPAFAIRKVDVMEVNTQDDLNAAQEMLHSIAVHKAPKQQRQEIADAKRDAQARLDRYHQLFAQGARQGVAAAAGNLAAELSSLRHEVTFSKARRARAMAQRATTNASSVELMEHLLRTLPPVPAEELGALEDQEIVCPLSGESVADALKDSHRNFFVFALRVRRPEDVIDAPTTLEVMQVLSGAYSNDAFRAGAEHAIRTEGPERAHGGFVGSAKNPVALGGDVGLFRGPDGEMMNACLPLYLSESHFARVRLQLKPILGYFFTLDPLGYKGDQTIALFGVLGNMLCMRAGTGGMTAEGSFTGSWADWAIKDFKKFCCGIHPVALEYLASGGYTGVPRDDIFNEFIASPAGRTKEKLSSLGVVIGWAAALDREFSPRFQMAFVEELWRRNFTTLYKGQPREPIVEILEQLLYGPADAWGCESGETEDNDLARNKASKDKEFATWALYRRGDLCKKQMEAAKKAFGSRILVVEGLISADAEYKPRQPLQHQDAPEFFDAIVEAELSKIRRANSFTAKLLDGRPLGDGFAPAERRLMLIQALQFVGNDVMNDAVKNGQYINTFDCFEGSGDTGRDAACICETLHERFEQNRREKLSACVERRNALITARRILATADLTAFAGRCDVSCPTRGGSVFENVVGLLTACSGDSSMAKAIPHFPEKVVAILTGKIDEHAVIAAGTSWVHCPAETARRLREAVGVDAFAKIELLMHGTWGHMYRESDLPNRHGHCNSNPNPCLTQTFHGFGFDAIGGA